MTGASLLSWQRVEFALNEHCASLHCAVCTVQVQTVKWVFPPPKSKALKPLTVKKGTQLKFVWDTKSDVLTHDLWQLPGPVAYSQCSFKSNKKLKELVDSQRKGSYTTKPLQAGTYFYACKVPGHCKSGGQKLKVTVK